METDSDKPWTLWWEKSDNVVAVVDGRHLTALLDRATADAAASFPMAELRSPAGAACAVGLGRQTSVATFSASHAAPPYYVSRGSLELTDPVVFFSDGHWTEFEPQAAIPTEAARAALEAFFATGERPSNFAWAEV